MVERKQDQPNSKKGRLPLHKSSLPFPSLSLSISLIGSPESVTLYRLDKEATTSPLLTMPVMFEPPRKIVRRSQDDAIVAADKWESAMVPQLPESSPTSLLLAFFEVKVLKGVKKVRSDCKF